MECNYTCEQICNKKFSSTNKAANIFLMTFESNKEFIYVALTNDDPFRKQAGVMELYEGASHFYY